MVGDRLPQREWSELFADRRMIAVLVTVVVLVGGLGGLFLYHPAPETPSSPPFAIDDPPVPVNGSYQVVGQMRATQRGLGTSYVERIRTYVPGEPAVALGRWTFGGGADRTTVSHYQRGTTKYVRQTWANVSRYRSNREYLSEETQSGEFFRAVNITRTIYRTESIEEGVDSVPTSSIPLAALGVLPYERRGTTTYHGQTVLRFVPQTGWTSHKSDEDIETAWVRAASGEVLVDPATGAVLFADVEFRLGQGDTWGEVLMKPTLHMSVEYRVTPDVERPGLPLWVDEIREVTNTTRDAASSQ